METINHECYVSLEVAKLLKEAGFDWEVNHSYPDVSALDNSCSGYMEDLPFYHNLNDGKYGGLSVPTLAVAQRWLREKKGFDINAGFTTFPEKKYYATIYKMNMQYSFDNNSFNIYEEALEAGIKKCLTILLEEKK